MVIEATRGDIKQDVGNNRKGNQWDYVSDA
jgi:hypothetical protein